LREQVVRVVEGVRAIGRLDADVVHEKVEVGVIGGTVSEVSGVLGVEEDFGVGVESV